MDEVLTIKELIERLKIFPENYKVYTRASNASELNFHGIKRVCPARNRYEEKNGIYLVTGVQ